MFQARKKSHRALTLRETTHGRQHRSRPSYAYERGRAAVELNEAGKQSQSLSHRAQKEVDPTAKSAAGWREKRQLQVRPAVSGAEQKQLAQRSQRSQVAWTIEKRYVQVCPAI